MQAAQIAKALRTMDPNLAQYKTINAFKDQALGFLDKVSQSTDPLMPAGKAA